MTIKDFIDQHQLQIDPASVRKRLKRQDHQVGVADELPPQILTILQQWYLQDKPEPPAEQPKPKKVNGVKIKKERLHFTDWLAMAPLPMLGLAASYGVFYFADYFVPTWVAVAEAAAFELTYIGLAAMRNLKEKQRKYAQKVSLGAVMVSIIYNTVAGGLHQDPNLLMDLPRFWFWMISILHGAPLALLAYLVADLLFHQK